MCCHSFTLHLPVFIQHPYILILIIYLYIHTIHKVSTWSQAVTCLFQQRVSAYSVVGFQQFFHLPICVDLAFIAPWHLMPMASDALCYIPAEWVLVLKINWLWIDEDAVLQALFTCIRIRLFVESNPSSMKGPTWQVLCGWLHCAGW